MKGHARKLVVLMLAVALMSAASVGVAGAPSGLQDNEPIADQDLFTVDNNGNVQEKYDVSHDTANRTKILDAPVQNIDSGEWSSLGAGSITEDNGTYYVSVRNREPRPVRARDLRVYKNTGDPTDPNGWTQVWLHDTTGQVDSHEASVLRKYEGEWYLYFTYDGANGWEQAYVSNATVEGLEWELQDMSRWNGLGLNGQKDPSVFKYGGNYYMLSQDAGGNTHHLYESSTPDFSTKTEISQPDAPFASSSRDSGNPGTIMYDNTSGNFVYWSAGNDKNSNDKIWYWTYASDLSGPWSFGGEEVLYAQSGVSHSRYPDYEQMGQGNGYITMDMDPDQDNVADFYIYDYTDDTSSGGSTTETVKTWDTETDWNAGTFSGNMTTSGNGDLELTTSSGDAYYDDFSTDPRGDTVTMEPDRKADVSYDSTGERLQYDPSGSYAWYDKYTQIDHFNGSQTVDMWHKVQGDFPAISTYDADKHTISDLNNSGTDFDMVSVYMRADDDQIEINRQWEENPSDEPGTDAVATSATLSDSQPYWYHVEGGNTQITITVYEEAADGGVGTQVGSHSVSLDSRFDGMNKNWGFAYHPASGVNGYFEQMGQTSGGSSSGTHTTEWVDLGQNQDLQNMEGVVSLNGESGSATVEVSDDQSTIADSKSFTLADGTNSYDLSTLSEHQYVRVVTDLSTSSSTTPQVDSYDLEATAAYTASGTVTDASDGSAVGGAQVNVYNQGDVGGTVVASDTTASDGSWSVGLSDGDYTAVASTSGYHDDQRDFSVAGGDTTGVDLALEPATAPAIDDASLSPNGSTERYETVTLEADVTDADFAHADGDTVTVEFYVDGTLVGSDTLTANGTASTTTTQPDGDYSWHAEATDDYGKSDTSATATFTIKHYDPVVDDSTASPDGQTIGTGFPTLDVNVSDRDFALDGDTLTADVYLDGAQVDTQTLNSNGTVAYDVQNQLTEGDHTWHLEVSDEHGNVVTSTTYTFTVTYGAPELSNFDPPDGANIETRDTTLSVDVDDVDFNEDGDTVTVEFYVNGELEGTQTLSSPGTASTAFSTGTGGSFDWHVVASDEYNNEVTSQTRTFKVPSTLYVRDETGDHTLLNDTNVTVQGRFYSGELIFEKSTTDGTINLTDMPIDRTYVLDLEAEGYHRRTILVESLYNQQDVYMLNESETSVFNEFRLQDLTGNYPSGETTLAIEKGVNKSGNITWETIAGDYFGADGSFKVDLHHDQRYRLIIRNDDGDSRVLGGYVAADTGVIELDVGKVTWDVEEPETLQWRTSTYNLTDSNPDPFGYVNFELYDPGENTTDLTVTIYEQGNESNVLYEETHPGPFGTFTLNESIEGEQVTDTTWVVDWEATKDGETINGSRVVDAAGKHPIEFPFDEKWGPAAVAGLLLFAALIFGGVHSNFGAIAVAGIGAVMWYMGWYTASVGIILLALVVGGLYVVGQGKGVGR